MEISKQFADYAARLAKTSVTNYYLRGGNANDFFEQRISLLAYFTEKLNSLNVTKGLPTLINVLSQCTKEERENVMPIIEAAAVLAQYGEMLGIATAWIEDLEEYIYKVNSYKVNSPQSRENE